ncbi:D-alanyl-D-alanine carboxypeptidase family protein [Microbacterium enclense]|uniref:D-alanyl-D-alanine carboxypeptidase (Penicillin-binding protein 5/6) n=1 Tax=Microbacterium enclense TaxID=993073 RepID=A0A1G6P2W0_9MICO|nr:D-alanyl-D-alanine carboxypeptidase [Microbacterium enclense]KSU52678.1 D-alanyl-D-alanine carboxypeptidase [Microbacterium enclense]SDC74399.1 D-alanyl-D-alanine carboxypeptidase (penicillin-binding protein 5/6) [Microbacterium enclense]
MHEQTPATRRDLRRPGDAAEPPEADAAAAEAPAEHAPASPVSAAQAPAASGTAVDPAPAAPVAAAQAARTPATSAGLASGTAVDPVPAAPVAAAQAPAASGAPVLIGALTWVDPDDAADLRAAPAAGAPGAGSRAADLLAGRRRRIFRPATVIPPVLLVLMLAVYAAATLLWPLNAVAPTTRAVGVQPVAAPAAEPAWPAEGEAAIAIDGVPETLSTAAIAPESIASITKVVTALVVLDRLPLAPGEQGPTYAFTQADSADYWQYRARGESSLDVPIDGSLTELQMLQGMLIASANNYAQRLASDLFGTDAEFSAAANQYLVERGIDGITIVNPTGIEAGNTATPAALISLAERALANPVIAEIVRTPELTLPGAGTFKNGNALLADPGVVGVKTGTLDAWNLLTAKDITVGDATIRAYAAVLGQPGPDSRNQATRDLFARIEQELQPRPSVTAGTVIGKVETLWGDDIDIVTAADATVVLWNGGAAKTSADFDLGDATEPGATVGTFTATGPVDADTVDVQLATEIEPPSPWWRLTHPLDLFGVND